MSDKPVSIEPANAGEDETEPEIELVGKRKTIAPVWKHFGYEKGKPRSPDRPKCRARDKKWQPRMETLPISTAIGILICTCRQWRSQVIGIGRAPAVRLAVAWSLTTLALARFA